MTLNKIVLAMLIAGLVSFQTLAAGTQGSIEDSIAAQVVADRLNGRTDTIGEQLLNLRRQSFSNTDTVQTEALRAKIKQISDSMSLDTRVITSMETQLVEHDLMDESQIGEPD